MNEIATRSVIIVSTFIIMFMSLLLIGLIHFYKALRWAAGILRLKT